MAFDNERTYAETHGTDRDTPSRRPECERCGDLLADAVDELLDPVTQAWFDLHMHTCAACQESFAEVQRGAAWLEMLKTPRPEPSAQLLERILAQTAGHMPGQLPEQPWQQAAASDQGLVSVPGRPMWPLPSGADVGRPQGPGKVLPFRPRVSGALPYSLPRGLARVLYEPRLAMTAAMAFFSIALTMNMTGVRLNDLHAEDLKPSNLRRTYYEATASAARRYESLRVVHVLESRVDDVREAGGSE